MNRLCLSVTCFLLAACQVESTRPLADAWVSIPAGCTEIGSTDFYREEAPPQNVCVEAFKMRTTEVTNAEFAEFVEATGYVTQVETASKAGDGKLDIDLPAGSMVFAQTGDTQNPWAFAEGASWRNPTGEQALDVTSEHASLPVVQVTHSDAAAYANWAGVRLPTEFEWEYAAQIGGVAGGVSVDNPVIAADKANTWQGIFPVINKDEDGFVGIAPVGSFPPDKNGIYDMIGNVWELTDSVYYPSHDIGEAAQQYPQGYDVTDPGRPVHVIKGGSYLCSLSYCVRYRPSARQPQDAFMATNHIGFRVVKN